MEAADTAARAAAAREQEAGNAAVGRREWSEAEARYTASLALHATAAAFSNRAAVRLAQGRAAEAVADARSALAQDGGFVRAYVRLSAAQRALGDDAAALAAAREGLALAERVASPLAAQLREAAAAAAASAAEAAERTREPRFERASAAARACFLSACAHCGATAREARLCGACRQVYFCDAECQRAAWPTHKAACAIAARAVASVAAEAGLTAPPRGGQAHALQNWLTEQPAHAHALQTLAWHLQHAPPPPSWRAAAGGSSGFADGPRGATGAVLFTVLREGSDDDTLCVALSPLALLNSSDPDTDDDQTLGLQASLSRVDIDVGFLVAIEDRRCEAVSMARLRYNRPTTTLARLAAACERGARMRVDARGLRAEVDVAPFHDV
jgi:hypothetical protein